MQKQGLEDTGVRLPRGVKLSAVTRTPAAARQRQDCTGPCEAIQRAMLEVLDVLSFGVILVDGAALVCLANARALMLLSREDGLATDGRRLRGMNAAATSHLRDACAEIGAGRAQRPLMLNLPRASCSLPLQVMVAPILSADVVAAPQRDVAAAIYISDPAEVIIPDAGMLRTGFGLSLAESRVAARLAAGSGIEEIREELRYTRETARWYVKQVLAKTGCRTRSEFTARAARSIAILGRFEAPAGRVPQT